MVQLVNISGVVTKNYTYDAFGVEANIDDNDTNQFRYCGEYFDSETGTIYLRARYYYPVIGRFISQDSWSFMVANDPLSLNLYTYCGNDPVNMIDENGHKPKYLSNKKLLSSYNVAFPTRVKAVYSAKTCLNKIYKYEKEIIAAVNEFNIPADMIRAVLYRELMCFGFEDLLADQAVKNKYEGRYLCVKRDDSSTGIAQIFAKTAMNAEKAVLGYNSTTEIWTMWRYLRDPATNIYYCAMVLRMKANELEYKNLGIDDYEKIKNIFINYNGSKSYGKAVLGNYKEFIQG